MRAEITRAKSNLGSLSFDLFFSSRRRHTRCLSDWSSDVCSSDLAAITGERPNFAAAPWWALLTDPHLGRPGRALVIAAAAALVFVVQHYLLTRRRGARSEERRVGKARGSRWWR